MNIVRIPMKKDKQLVTSAAKTDAANPIAPMSTTPVDGAFTPACTKKTVQFETTPSELFCALVRVVQNV